MSRPAKFVRSFLPATVVALAALTQACTAETAEPAPVPGAEAKAEAQPTEPGAIADRLSGSSVAPARNLGEDFSGANQANAGWPSDAAAQLEVPGLKTTYDILSYSFAVTGGGSMGSTTGAATNAGTITTLDIQVKRKDGAPSLATNVFNGKALGNVTILAKPASSKEPPAKLMALTNAMATAASTSSSGTAIAESVTLSFQTIEITKGDVAVFFDRSTSTAKLSGTCPATQAYVDAAVALPPGAPEKAIDAVNVAVSNIQDPTGYSSSRPTLDVLSVQGQFEKDGICAAYYAYVGKSYESTSIAVQGPAYQKNLITWQTCLSFPHAVSFSGGADAAVESIDFEAGALIRTDRTFDAYGKESSKSTFGWSFINNAPTTSCN